ncbi:Z-ring formation inhibitor MciZ [Thermoflavimicrobium dichotomicum]|uniref:Z-ring formation inhibitor MciZ n=1 Tax=Thermoflavimicrobium dichotomicum TaxID=46223 RepID=A0A1I3Q793_9BACL|nr:Z-ring formation inhibitor MciZ [Thermoflavimicrobium dichotomicum]SFJ29267.1 Protein of unknown function [Thermoflavimicrobium dichotomicum]
MQIHFGASNCLLVGKAWEIRSRLREWARHPLTVQEFLSRQPSVYLSKTNEHTIYSHDRP